MAVALCNLWFRDCTPAEEFFEYPLFFPKENYRDVAPPSEVGEADQETAGAEVGEDGVLLGGQRSMREQVHVPEAPPPPPPEPPKPSALQLKFEELSGGKETIEPQKVGDLARKFGLAPSQADIQRLHAELGTDVSLEQAMEWMKSVNHPEDTEDNLLQFFQHYDTTGSGMLSRATIRNLLASYGEPMTEEEINTILAEMQMTGDPVNYKEFISKLLVADDDEA